MKAMHPQTSSDEILFEVGAPLDGRPQMTQRRLYMQLQVFSRCLDAGGLISVLEASGLEGVLYADLNDPLGVGVLLLTEDPEALVGEARSMLAREPFSSLERKPNLTMVGRTYATGHEASLEEWLLVKPRHYALNPQWPWAIWYPLRRKPEFSLLSRQEQGKILYEHAMMGKPFAQGGHAFDIRLACYGLDTNDNEFVLGLVGPKLYPLSRLVQEMRKSQQTARYIESLGPFFVGKALWQSPWKGKERSI